MSIINNIQGTLTQTQTVLQLQQQQGDVSRIHQQVGELKTQEDSEIKKNSISEQDDVNLGELHKDKEGGSDQKHNKRRKKTLDQLKEEAEQFPDRPLGGGLIDTQA
jgi:hypothetical protein